MAQIKEVNPVLPARNVSDAVEYYINKLGFHLLFQDDQHNPQYAGIKRDGVELHLQFQFEEDFKAGRAGQAMLRFSVDDPDELFVEYKDMQIFHERTQLKNTPWGTREFSFPDLNGNGLTFSQDV